jgi:regulator of cell morphogenesis and NO signaling
MSTVLDFRNFEPRAQSALFFSLFENLKEGDSFEIVNDHDPALLLNQLQSMDRPRLNCKYEAQGPQLWKVQISKTSERETRKDSGEEGCCGLCGGHSEGDEHK